MFWKRKRREPEHVAALRKVVEDLASKVDDLTERFGLEANLRQLMTPSVENALSQCGEAWHKFEADSQAIHRDLDKLQAFITAITKRLSALESRPAPAVVVEAVRSEMHELLGRCLMVVTPRETPFEKARTIPIKSGTITIGDGPAFPVKSGTITIEPGAKPGTFTAPGGLGPKPPHP